MKNALRSWAAILGMLFCALALVATVPWGAKAYLRATQARYQRVVESVRGSVHEVRQVEALSTQVDSSISYFISSPIWNSRLAVADRFIITLQFPFVIRENEVIDIDRAKMTLTVIEVTSIKRLSDGRFSLSFSGLNRSYDAAQLTAMLADGVTLVELGLPDGHIEPVRGFSEYWSSRGR